MYKKLRWQFIGVAVSAIFIVLIILVAGINIAHRQVTYRGVDMTVDMIDEHSGKIPERDPKPERPKSIGNMGFNFTPETPFDTRYFTVVTDETGNVLESHTESIASVDEESAKVMAEKVFARNADVGNIENFRFHKEKDDDTCTIIFVDITRQQTSVNNLLVLSLIIMAGAMILTFVLVFFLSRKVIAPTIRSIESQKQFITDASHEMKTPLTAISAYTSLMENEESNREWVSGIDKETKRLSKLVTDLVELSRWDEFTPLTRVEDFNLSDSLWDVAAPYQNIAVGNGKELIVNVEDDLKIRGDEISIQKAISTLLENAVKYSLPGSDIFLVAMKKKHNISVTIRNECQVDKNADLSRLFDRFYRMDKSRTRSNESGQTNAAGTGNSTGGNGVGLSIAKAIIEAHGGSISARYDSDTSIIFEIILRESTQ